MKIEIGDMLENIVCKNLVIDIDDDEHVFMLCMYALGGGSYFDVFWTKELINFIETKFWKKINED